MSDGPEPRGAPRSPGTVAVPAPLRPAWLRTARPGPAGAAPPQRRYLLLSGTTGAAMAVPRARPRRRPGEAKRCRSALREGSANPQSHGMNLV